MTGKILVIASGRGSCGGSGTIFEMLLNDTAPAALVFCHRESILTLGVVIASELFDRQIPVLQVQQEAFSRLKTLTTANIIDGSISEGADVADPRKRARDSGQGGHAEVALSDLDRQFLDGAFGEAARVAMRIVLRAAKLEAARERCRRPQSRHASASRSALRPPAPAASPPGHQAGCSSDVQLAGRELSAMKRVPARLRRLAARMRAARKP